MKKLFTIITMFVLGVLSTTAQTYEISPSNGDVATGAKSCEWNYTADNNPAGLKIIATDANGNRVNAISATTGNSKLKFSAGGAIEGTETTSSAPTTFTVSVNENYLITGFCMVYTASSANRVTISNEYGYNITPSSRTTPETMEKKDISVQSIKFYVSAAASPASYAAQVNSFTISLQKVGGEAPVEYTVSATANPAEGGVATVNGVEGEATTTGNVELNAVPAFGYKFIRWEVECNEVSATARYTEVVNSDKQYVAVFEKQTNANDWYASIEKPSFGKAGNTTFVKSATLTGGVEAEVAGIQAVVGQACVTNAINIEKGAQFDLNITYQLNWGDLAIYQIDNDGATKEYGYYYGSWEPNGSTAKVAQNIAEEGISISEVADGACTATFPISINENHNPGDIIVVRAITGVKNNNTNSAYEQNIAEGGYVDFLFVVTESHTLAVNETGYATLCLGFNAAIPAGVEAYTATEISNGYVKLTQIEGAIPANAAVVVKANEGNYDFIQSNENVATIENNLLKGTLVDENIHEEAYVLWNDNGTACFCKAEMTGTSWLNNANKAYLPASAVPTSLQDSASFSFRFDGNTTVIENVEIENKKVEIYDLSGRKVENPTNGIYIVNGVKNVIK